jgi:GTP cyclohydrolase I
MNNLANENQVIKDMDKYAIERRIKNSMQDILNELGINCIDPNTEDTAERIARMYVREIFKGRFEERPKLTAFPNTKKLDQLYTVGGIAIRSTCSHHFAPIIGECFIGVIPGESIIGLSKFSRLVDWIVSRPQIQEEMTVQIADEIEKEIQPLGLAVVVKARHYCMIWRGVKETNSIMTTSVMRGFLKENHSARQEFLELIKSNNKE